MKPLMLLPFILLAGLIPTVIGQSKFSEDITVEGIRHFQRAQNNRNQTVIEIELRSKKGFRVGGLYFCLRIGRLFGIPEEGMDTSNKTRLFYVSKNEWKKLKSGDAMSLSWGCGQRQIVTPEAYESAQHNGFGFLNKKMLRRGKKN